MVCIVAVNSGAVHEGTVPGGGFTLVVNARVTVGQSCVLGVVEVSE